MGSWTLFLFAYLLGGLTLIPLLVVVALTHAHYILPHYDTASGGPTRGSDSIVQPGDDTAALEREKAGIKDGDNTKGQPSQENEVAAGYFAVCREYVPMGINAKPIERTTPVGSATVTAPSQSVYQTMYRSIFERKNPQGSLENKTAQNQRPKNAGNVFYVVLRHGHLLLFDDEEQFEVRHVVSLANYDVSIYSGENVLPEGELFIKRNALRLSRRQDGSDTNSDTMLSKPFYLFSEDSSAKEDFYFAMLRNQHQHFDSGPKAPKPKQFDVKNIISLVQRLHSSEDHLQTRWLNAMIGRVFLGIYQTADVEHFIREKLEKKISRVKTPVFLTNIKVGNIDPGDSAPVILHPKHKDLNIEGECSMEADVKYNGNFRIEVAATARLDLGPRFKVREVNLVLAVVLRKLEGHVFFKIKPPPSNRVWFSFQTMPKMEMTIEPIVSSRQITYTLILRQIENRIKEVFAETLVQPFWDDIPFFNTEHKKWRGGIWEGDDAVVASKMVSKVQQDADSDTAEALGAVEDATGTHDQLPLLGESQSAPVGNDVPPTGLFGRKLDNKSSANSVAATSTGADPRSSTSSLPRAFRAPSLSNVADPVVGTDSAYADAFKPSSTPPDHASEIMAALSARDSPSLHSQGSPTRPASMAKDSSHSSSAEATDSDKDQEKTPVSTNRRGTASSSETAAHEDIDNPFNSSPHSLRDSLRSNTSSTTRSNAGSISKSFFNRRDTAASSTSNASTTSDAHQKRGNTLAAVANAATQARQWGWNALQKRREGNGSSGDPDVQVDLNKPMGRGRPLPPPGTPLPRPDRNSKVTAIPVPLKRKPVAAASGPERRPSEDSSRSHQEPEVAPPLPNRRNRGSRENIADDGGTGLFVVEAPMESEPSTPLDESMRNYGVFGNAHSYDQGCAKSPDYSSNHNGPTRADEPVSTLRDPQPELQAGEATGASDHGPQVHLNAKPVQVEQDDDDDDGYSGWMDNTDDIEVEMPTAATHTNGQQDAVRA